MTSSTGTRLGDTGDVQRLHFVFVVLVNSCGKFRKSLLREDEEETVKGTNVIAKELEAQAHKIKISAKLTAKQAQLEVLKLQNCYASGQQLVIDRKLAVQAAAHELFDSSDLAATAITKPEIGNSYVQNVKQGEDA